MDVHISIRLMILLPKYTRRALNPLSCSRNFSTSWITDENIAVLLRMPNVILTPHLAFFTRDTRLI